MVQGNHIVLYNLEERDSGVYICDGIDHNYAEFTSNATVTVGGNFFQFI